MIGLSEPPLVTQKTTNSSLPVSTYVDNDGCCYHSGHTDVFMRAEFHQCLDAWTSASVVVTLVYCCRIALPTNCHHQLQEAQHVTLWFIITGPGTGLASPGDIKLLSQSSPFLVDHSHSTI